MRSIVSVSMDTNEDGEEEYIKSPLDGAWNIGRSADLLGVIAGQTDFKDLLQLKGEDKVASPITLSFSADYGVKLDGAPFPNVPVDCFVTIQWGTGGVQHEMEVDVGVGTVVSIFASFVRCRVQLRAALSASTAVVRGSACYGLRPNTPPYRTIIADTTGTQFPIIAGGVGVLGTNFKIPNFARTVQPLFRSAVTAQGPYSLAMTNDVVLGGYRSSSLSATGANFQAMLGQDYPIPTMARFVQLINEGADPINQGGFLFKLAL